MFLWRTGGWRGTPHSWLVSALHSFPSLHCTVKVAILFVTMHCLCHPASIQNFSLPTCFLATLLDVHPAGLGVSLNSVPWYGKSCMALCWHVEQVLFHMPAHPSVTVICSSEPLKPHC